MHKLKASTSAAAALLALSGCKSTYLRSLEDIPKDRSRPVQASAKNWNLFFIGLNNSANEQAVKDLEKSCPTGAVKVSLVESEFTFWLAGFLYAENIKAHGYCEDPISAHRPSSDPSTRLPLAEL